MKQHVIMRQSHLLSQCIAGSYIKMDGDITPVNVTVNQNSHTHLVVTIESTWIFTIFSLTIFTLLNNAPEIMVLLTDYHNPSQVIKLPLQLKRLQTICVEKSLSNPNKTFFCPFSSPKTSQDLVVMGLREDITKKVSNIVTQSQAG